MLLVLCATAVVPPFEGETLKRLLLFLLPLLCLGFAWPPPFHTNSHTGECTVRDTTGCVWVAETAVYRAAVRVGLPPGEAVRVAQAEALTKFVDGQRWYAANSHNPRDPQGSYGIMQINKKYWDGTCGTPVQWVTVNGAMEATVCVREHSRTGWAPWSGARKVGLA